jgi:dTDP-4-dehydrorhamnose reductase
MRLLLLGGSGQLGTQLRKIALPQGIQLFAPTRAAIDLADPTATQRLVAAERWNVVINAAGYTNVDRAESEEEVAFAVNAKAAACLAEETGKRGIPLIYISTDYVFDGGKGAPYDEQDVAAPINAYGRSKLAGERYVSTANPRHVILRAAWLFSANGTNFVRAILRLAQERERLTVVTDQLGCPTSARDLAKACLDIALFCATEPDQKDYGLYHFAGAGAATRFEFANAILEEAAGRLGRLPQVVPISTTQYPSSVSRPADSRLDCTAVQHAFGLTPRPWRHALAETIHCILTSKSSNSLLR